MFPNSSNLGRPPFPLERQQYNFFSNLPVNIPPVLLFHQQIIDHPQFPSTTALLGGSLSTIPAVSPPPFAYRNGSPVHSSSAPASFRGRKRLKEQDVHYEVKRQRFHSPHRESTSANHAVPLPEDHRRSFPGSISSPLYQAHYSSDLTGCVPPLQEASFPDPIEIALPVAKDKLSQQVLELFQACQQQSFDLNKKELCRTQLQREIQQIFPNSRLFLVGSSLNGFGTRSSDGDLCLVVKEEPINQKTEARHILSLLQKHFCRKLSSYIERPQLIRAKVPIVKFRDKVSCVEFDLNVNNVVGIRNTFLLRTYAYIESRVRPLVLVVKKWASFRGINDASRGTLSSYSLVLMVLHYLQTLPEPILPSLQKNYPESFDPSMQLHLVHQAPCTIPPYLSKNESTLGDLLLGFLKYYATEFDWRGQMISVREAKAIPRPDGVEWRNKFICVEEPFDRTNTARAVHEKQKFDIIIDEFCKSWQRLRDRRDLNCILPLRATIQKR
ncbi:poly(A) RNA polymerase GLD2 isoform X1 [Hemicordylus capensis]|uniref:poly(A) RNA polymerase GLD2 isoform X1 n=1 Tax=Hemicordylus capensis TaxID=884348 RepID=UPI0023035F2E|nr:poly(A) RNA polymerase GLD2 isoform X1 [Hemicordylus capensis]XP_053156641.1 poly(A) RNA polymerase GLD2 isoform X1 [Hemicordylus capensis]XP_053156642.1 poly(A) RNA polymerase GLD2 isoform X1 [Hemicordylus capensis]XP_053156643.1 poly(A) RNA polymerase GLD2 isoform X1 [Hemicordylus capensis]